MFVDACLLGKIYSKYKIKIMYLHYKKAYVILSLSLVFIIRRYEKCGK